MSAEHPTPEDIERLTRALKHQREDNRQLRAAYAAARAELCADCKPKMMPALKLMAKADQERKSCSSGDHDHAEQD